MTQKIVLPDGDPHMAAVLSRPEFAARLDRLGGAALHADVPASDDELIRRIGDAQVVILGQYLTGPVLRRLPALRLVAFTGTGAASFVDLPTAAERGIAVANVTGYGDIAVAEHALALTLALARRVAEGDGAIRAGQWQAPRASSWRARPRASSATAASAPGSPACSRRLACGSSRGPPTPTRPG
jgi:lactate dehydrogenase-like 2-hydroxyacid dehydrogenase